MCMSRAKNKDKVRRQDKLSSLLFGGIWPPTASFTVRLFMYSRRVDTGGLGLYYIYCIYLYISVYTPAGPAPLCTQYYPFTPRYLCGRRFCPPKCNDDILPWLLYVLYVSLFYGVKSHYGDPVVASLLGIFHVHLRAQGLSCS